MSSFCIIIYISTDFNEHKMHFLHSLLYINIVYINIDFHIDIWIDKRHTHRLVFCEALLHSVQVREGKCGATCLRRTFVHQFNALLSSGLAQFHCSTFVLLVTKVSSSNSPSSTSWEKEQGLGFITQIVTGRKGVCYEGSLCAVQAKCFLQSTFKYHIRLN